MKLFLSFLLLSITLVVNAQYRYGNITVNGRVTGNTYHGTARVNGTTIYTTIHSNGRYSSCYSTGTYKKYSTSQRSIKNLSSYNGSETHNEYYKSNSNDLSFMILTQSINDLSVTDKPTYIGGTLMNITFLWHEENIYNLLKWGTDKCVGSFIKDEIILTEKNQKSKQGIVLMYKINGLRYFDIDLGGGINKETYYDTEYYNRITSHYSHDTGIGKRIIINDIKYKPTLNCMISLDVISLFNNGVKRIFILQPSVILSTRTKPVIGLNLGMRIKNFL